MKYQECKICINLEDPTQFLVEQFKGTMTTLLGCNYIEKCGSIHDSNCKKRFYLCSHGGIVCLSRQQKCDKCDWVGKESCDCHTPNKKIKEWPNITCNDKLPF